MPRIRPLDPADSEGSNREIFQQLLNERGHIPNMMLTVGHRPEHLRTMVAHMSTIMRNGSVPPLLKELIAVRVSRINACDHCLVSHTALATRLGATDRQIEALNDLSGAGEAEVAGFPADCLGTAPTEPPADAGEHPDAPFTPAQRAALLFAEQMTMGAGRVPDATFLALREQFDPAEIVEIASVVGLLN
ncbi:MAG: carboxymuconolactone decarboxylase family protein, partial [Vicinamibacteria bacterium]